MVVKLRRIVLWEAILLLLLATASGTWFSTQYGSGQPAGMGWLFQPALMVATGNGFISPDFRQMHPDVSRFLSGELESITPDIVNSRPVDKNQSSIDAYAGCHPYLIYSIAVTWRIFGISWNSLKALAAVVFMLTAILTYGMFRLGCGRCLSLLGTALFFVSPHFLDPATISLRDASKVPSLFCCFLIIGALIAKPRSKRVVLGLALVLGLTVGVGLGFRQDMLPFFPLGLLALLFAIGRIQAPRRMIWMTVPAVYLIAFLLPAAPVFISMARINGGTPHYLLQSMCTHYEETMGIGPASYNLISSPSDMYIHSVMSSYGLRTHRLTGEEARKGKNEPAPFSRAIMQMGSGVWWDSAMMFPSDFITRCLAATRQITTGSNILTIENHPLMPVQAEVLLTRFFATFGLPLAMLLLLFISLHDRMTAIAAMLFLLALGAYTSLGFHYRHVFHMGFLPFWIVAVVAQMTLETCWRTGKSIRRDGFRACMNTNRPQCAKALKNAAVVAAVAAIILLLPLQILRVVQHRTVSNLLSHYASASLQPLDVERIETNDRVSFRLRSPLPSVQEAAALPYYYTPADYLVLELAPCTKPRNCWIEHDDRAPDLSTRETIAPAMPEDTEPTLFFFPAYLSFAMATAEAGNPGPIGFVRTQFKGVGLPKQHAGAFRRLYRVADVSQFRLLPTITLHADKRAFRHFQTLWP